MNNIDIVLSDEVIETSADNDQMDQFEQAVEALEPEDLVKINDYLNAGVANESDWHAYWDAFAKYEWREFGNAYAEAMGRDFTLE